MLVERIFSFKSLLSRTWIHFTYLTVYSVLVFSSHEYLNWTFLTIPWLPVSLVGIAVSFYVGFKNNSAYDRAWEARKIWGGIVNSSRAFGSQISHFVSEFFSEEKGRSVEVEQWKKKMIHRHIAWLYHLRNQLLQPREWEHLMGNWGVKRLAKQRIKRVMAMFDIPSIEEVNDKYLSKEDQSSLENSPNKATSLIHAQSKSLQDLRELELIEDFRHMVMQGSITEFFTLQGKLERIKNFPLPRTYASVSYYFVAIFVLLLPFGLVSEFQKMGPSYDWLMVPFSVLVSWIFVVMELIGDYTENPFESLPGDNPMFSISRAIERDLLHMLDDPGLPPPVVSKNKVIM